MTTPEQKINVAIAKADGWTIEYQMTTTPTPVGVAHMVDGVPCDYQELPDYLHSRDLIVGAIQRLDIQKRRRFSNALRECLGEPSDEDLCDVVTAGPEALCDAYCKAMNINPEKE